jgi:hypothetical protein
MIDKNLVVQSFDASSLKLSGEPVPIAESVQFNPYRYTGGWDLSEHGAFVYTTGVGIETVSSPGSISRAGSWERWGLRTPWSRWTSHRMGNGW